MKNQRGLILALIITGAVIFGGTTYYKAESGKMCGGIAGNLPEKQCALGFSCRSAQPSFPDAQGKCSLILPSFVYNLYNRINKPDSPRVVPLDPGTSSSPTVQDECVVGGCNGELCLDKEVSDKGIASICLYKPEFACYKSATCEKQANGKCGWTQTSELKACLSNPPTY